MSDIVDGFRHGPTSERALEVFLDDDKDGEDDRCTCDGSWEEWLWLGLYCGIVNNVDLRATEGD